MYKQSIILIANIKTSVVAIGGIILAFLVPLVPQILIITIAIGIDTLFGILKAKKLKEPVTSRKMSKLISKTLLYQSALIMSYMTEHFILSDIIGLFSAIPLLLTKLLTVTLLFIEVQSINENYQAISGVSIWGKFKELITRAKEVKKDISELTNNEKK